MTIICISEVQNFTAVELDNLINQLEDAFQTDMPYEQKVKLNHLIGSVIEIYMAKQGIN